MKSYRILCMILIGILTSSFLLSFSYASITNDYNSIKNNDVLFENTPYNFTSTFYNESNYKQSFENAIIQYECMSNSSYNQEYQLNESYLENSKNKQLINQEYYSSNYNESNIHNYYGNPNNINMTKGTTDSADNMKTNNDVYTTFTSTHGGYLHEMPSQWDDFTFTYGTGYYIGDLETIDADYSVITADTNSTGGSNIVIPDGDAGPNQWTPGPGGDHFVTVDEYIPPDTNDLVWISFSYDNYLENFAMSSFGGVVDGSITSITVWIYAKVAKAVSPEGNIFFQGGWRGWQDDFNVGLAYDWYSSTWSGLAGGQADLDALQIEFRADTTPLLSYNYIAAVYAVVYYQIFDYDLDVQVDIQVDDGDCSSVEYLKFSHKTNVSATIDLDIWNWDTSTWFEIESVDNSVSFADDSFTLGSTSVYVNETFGVRIRFQLNTGSNDFELQIDRLRLDYLTTPAELEFTITFSFTNYDDDLLAMTVQSWQMTNKSQTIVFSIWNYDTETYAQISNSSDTTEALKEYNSTSPSNFLSPTGTAKLCWVGSDNLNDFILYIDYLVITLTYNITYSIDLTFNYSFNYYNFSKLLFELQSIHYTSFNTYILLEIWNNEISEWIVISNNSKTNPFSNTFESSYPSELFNDSYIKIRYFGSNDIQAFTFSIDLLSESIWIKTTLEYENTFTQLGYWRYRFILNNGSFNNITQDWITFKIVSIPFYYLGILLPFYIYIIIGVVFTLTILYFIRKEYVVDKVKVLKLYCLMIGVDFILLLCTLQSIQVFLQIGNNQESNWLFTLLNALIFGVYLNIVGFGAGKIFRRDIMKYTVLFTLIFLAICGFGYLNFLFKFNFPFNFLFHYKYFSMSSIHGIRFFASNFVLFTLILFLSFITESESEY